HGIGQEPNTDDDGGNRYAQESGNSWHESAKRLQARGQRSKQLRKFSRHLGRSGSGERQVSVSHAASTYGDDAPNVVPTAIEGQEVQDPKCSQCGAIAAARQI